MRLYSLESIPYYNSIQQEYTNIITLNKSPEGPLKSLTKTVRLNKLSPFETHNNICPKPSCIIGITNINNPCEMMCIDDLPILFEFLIILPDNGLSAPAKIPRRVLFPLPLTPVTM